MLKRTFLNLLWRLFIVSVGRKVNSFESGFKSFFLNLVAGQRRDADFESLRRILIINIGVPLSVALLILFGTIVYFDNIPHLWLVDYSCAVLLTGLLVYTHKSGNYRLAIYLSMSVYTFLCYYLFVTGGDNQTGYAWYFIYPVLAYVALGAKKGTIGIVILVVPTLLLFFLDDPPGIISEYPPNLKYRLTGTFFVIAILAYISERVRVSTHQKLEKKNADLKAAISELQAAETELRNLGDFLESEVDRRTQQFRQTNFNLMQEVQERTKAEKALRESEEKFRLIAENTGDVISVFDMNTNLIYLSPSSKRVRGYDFEEARRHKLEDVLTPESAAHVEKLYAEEMALEATGTADPTRVRVMELQEYRSDGSLVWMEDCFSFIRDENRKAVGILSVSRNIDERKKSEQERAQLEEQLRQAQKLEAVGTLAGGLAHDFNNLLTAIQGDASLMLLRLTPSHPFYARLRHIEQQVASGANLTRQLLGFARGGRFEVKPTNLNTLADQTLAMFGRTHKDIVTHQDLAGDIWTIDADQGQLEQIFMNLFVNAVHAMPDGGRISVATENCTLTAEEAAAQSVAPGRYVRTTVSDTGVGMDDNTVKRIFEPFFTTKAKGRGTGLGLAMVYGIIKGHKGVIEVKSEPGKGSSFIFHLPASEKIIAPESPQEREVERGTETILVIDDEESVLDINCELLRALGYKVYPAATGQEALAIYKEKEIDLVILDMVMPGMSGSDIFDALREINQDLCVILSSGYSLEGQAREIMERGCRGFLQKPFELETLSQKVRAVLDKKKAVTVGPPPFG